MPKKAVTDDLLIKIGQVMSERWSSSSKVWTDVLKGIGPVSEKNKIRKIYKMEGSQIYIGSTRTYDCGGNQVYL